MNSDKINETWAITVNGEIEKEIHNDEKEAFTQFDIYTEEGSDNQHDEIQLVKVLKTNK